MWISAPTHYKVGTLTTLASITDLVMLLSYKSVYKDDEQRDSSEKKKEKVYKQANFAVVDGKPTKTVIATLWQKANGLLRCTNNSCPRKMIPRC